MEYNGKLPAAQIRSKNLEEFENILLGDCRFTNFLHYHEISISFRNFSEKSDTVKKFLKDPTLPKEIRDFSWRINCEEGSIWLRASTLGTELTISGDKGWVIKKKDDIYAFLKKHKHLSRGIFNSSLFILGNLILAMILAMDSADEMIKSGPQIHLGFLFLIGLFLGIFSLFQMSGNGRKLIPHLTIELEEIERYGWKENFIVALVASIMGAGVLILVMN